MLLDNLTVTDAGRGLIAAAIAAGAELTFTRCSVGSGTPTGALTGLTDLANRVGDWTIAGASAEDDEATVIVQMAALPSAYYLRELGIFAQVGSGAETLFAVCTDANPQYIQPSGASAVEATYSLLFAFSGASDVVAEIASVQWTRRVDFDAHVADNERHVTAEDRAAWNSKVSLVGGRLPYTIMPLRNPWQTRTITAAEWGSEYDITSGSYVTISLPDLSAGIYEIYAELHTKWTRTGGQTVESVTEMHFEATAAGGVSEIIGSYGASSENADTLERSGCLLPGSAQFSVAASNTTGGTTIRFYGKSHMAISGNAIRLYAAAVRTYVSVSSVSADANIAVFGTVKYRRIA